MKSKIYKSLSLLLLVLCSIASSTYSLKVEGQNSKELDDLNSVKDNGDIAQRDAATAQELKQLSSISFFTHDDKDNSINLDSNEVNLKYDVEVLESGDLKKETEPYEEQFRGPAALLLDTDNFSDEDIEVHKVPRPKNISYFALATALTVFVMLALIIYIVLITWRRNLEQRYGARILLGTNCDDDDFAHQINNGANSLNTRQLPLNPV